MIPSVKTIETRLSIPRDTAIKLRKLLDGRLDPLTFNSVAKWVSQCYNRPSQTELVMCAANELLETHGVEGFSVAMLEGAWLDRYHGNIHYSYCNAGDPYVNTLIRDHAKGRYIIGCWGDLAEKDPALSE